MLNRADGRRDIKVIPFQKIISVAYIDENDDNHFRFYGALKEANPSAVLSSFYHLGDFLNYFRKVKPLLPSIIFLDYWIPGNEDFKGVSAIKQALNEKDIPVMVYAEMITEQLRNKARQQGATDFILMPHNFKDLTDLLSDFFSQRRTLEAS